MLKNHHLHTKKMSKMWQWTTFVSMHINYMSYVYSAVEFNEQKKYFTKHVIVDIVVCQQMSWRSYTLRVPRAVMDGTTF